MFWYQVFSDGVEYEARAGKPFVPPDITIKQVWEAVPKHLFKKSTTTSLYYIARHLLITYALYVFAQNIDLVVSTIGGTPLARQVLKTVCWTAYWGFQGFAFAGIWCIGHDAGHGALSDYGIVNDILGLALHSSVLTPYHAWRFTHRAHHKSTQSVERDETYMPFTRRDFKLPDGKVAVKMDYTEILEETPAFTLFKLFVRQFFGFQLYLLHNRKGNRKYPAWTSHYRPTSQLFKPQERPAIILSNVALIFTFTLIGLYIKSNGWGNVMKYYFIPWLFQHNWMVMFTYLQHSDPTIPYYRKDEWTFVRGALATIDRPLFGWVGRVFLHNIATDHLAHHFFSTIPFYNLPEVTKAIKPVLGEYYSYDSTPVLAALWRSFTQCAFIEDEGDVLFYKNWYGESAIELDEKVKGKSKPVDAVAQEEIIVD
ncbi:fatty acid desaturase-domain-containing protein [Rhodocollybia butyracea]|uniref:Fatty acid desaturase-domain-containing protein n=1 Tax=Rhodocollybia butyracea TaxID=206335 RepID=A0A9P5QBV6_9AGAR|nr:fatty acid desaturase-domain-containing protein [Rhodocollybia butyracea]